MKSLPFRTLRVVVRSAACVGLSVLAACASPPTRFYTLAGDYRTDAAPGISNAVRQVDVLAVRVPAPVAGSRLVVQTSPARVDILEEDRWASPVDDEIRTALSALITRRLNAVDVHRVPHDDNFPVYRVTVDVQRFESWPGSHVLIDAVWSVQATRGQQTLNCRSAIRENVANGNDALVAGHRLALEAIAVEIAAGIRAVAAKPGSLAAFATSESATPSASAARCPASASAS
ncbi:TPA: membrane integrity-associated transporter subunit PqiC [Burkholderia territorii]|uniref:PqiC family protein n=1 Tax=Burkholderia territorii TaxID=1503055 RepID=UPI0011C8F3B5|nr:PqiC family protein [Burkholderia territorii]TXG13518.1 membrane integrity-associated transporter subunit PqiC [Burkholderia territorii]HDR8857104.1 membrane integrity-associated transporter subunit PqiC [Burkholderia territorii]HDR8863042.1 membrane integrity-associated transporter subunit PqiC [Burkholderia territorii]HDR8869322.1 membrane integrity-associated transporter subunit PqiC [Burkholderia territorii]HDR8876019.1 membrane integrity-associated transporter subunit PqiC [Burkholderi